MKSRLCLALLLSTMVAVPAIAADNYQHHLQKKGIHISWTLQPQTIDIELAAPTKGWVAVGFNPSQKMKDANIIIGYVKSGQVVLRDDFGTNRGAHRADSSLGGTSNITNIAGFEKDGRTTLRFTLPLKSQDKFDQTINSGENRLILAYGKKDSFSNYHGKTARMTVNLSTGQKNSW